MAPTCAAPEHEPFATLAHQKEGRRHLLAHGKPAAAVLVHEGEVALGLRMALVRGPPVPPHRLVVTQPHPAPLLEQGPQAALCGGEAADSRLQFTMVANA